MILLSSRSARFLAAALGASVGACLLFGASLRADDGVLPRSEMAPIWRTIFARPAPRAMDGSETERRDLGALLFSDPRLSREGNRSCASCHQPERGFTDGLARAAGRDGSALKRNAPHLYNLADARSFYWDGREATLESQARIPLYSDNELGAEPQALVEKLSADEELKRRIATAFPETPVLSEDVILQALAAYERSLTSPETRFDAWVQGNNEALGETERRGFELFVGKGGCVACHGGWRMTDDQFHDVGLDSSDPGRGAVAGGAAGVPAFKTPGLRQARLTAPYMHDGSLATLEDVVAHYAGNLRVRPSLAPNIVRDLRLSPEERAQLVAFLKTL